MSGLWMLQVLREAAEALPNGTAKERAAWCMRRQRELQGVEDGAKPFADVADDPVVQKASQDGDR